MLKLKLSRALSRAKKPPKRLYLKLFLLSLWQVILRKLGLTCLRLVVKKGMFVKISSNMMK